MKKHMGILIILGLLSPSIALAQSGASVDVNTELGVQTATGAANGGKANASATGTVKINAGNNKPATTTGNATSSAKRADSKPETTGNPTSAAAKEKETGNATSSAHKPSWGAKGGLIGYIKSLFGLSSGSSTADVRAEMNASTTVSTSNSQGVGFFARIMGLFGFGK